ncbi:uncharacterized protein LOC121261552 [Juglans microcarpa x Juglans regia]|uniref:uncharacterized protein LOC121261552 n=1 Tax=Juglans microcarpa x Juglans regia TaxID=2249226 RepID=UPI001B7E0130|nr:uncharacterized protein LOC121261552 [Juglans microcarpa x Juglans regia]
MTIINVQGDARGESSRGKGVGRGVQARRFVPYSCRARRPRGVRINSYHSSTSDADKSGSDDSTQPPSHPWEPPCPIHQPPPHANIESSLVREPEPNREDIGTIIICVLFQ